MPSMKLAIDHFPGQLPSWPALAVAWLRRWRAARSERSVRRAAAGDLASMDARALADLAVGRGEIGHVVRWGRER
jgi:uncharacterized protein YjiS (DUF1127 family)